MYHLHYNVVIISLFEEKLHITTRNCMCDIKLQPTTCKMKHA